MLSGAVGRGRPKALRATLARLLLRQRVPPSNHHHGPGPVRPARGEASGTLHGGTHFRDGRWMAGADMENGTASPLEVSPVVHPQD